MSSRMRRALLIVAALGFLAAADPLADAGLTPDQVKTALVESIGAKAPVIPLGLGQVSAASRAAVVRAAGAVVLEFYGTAAFRERYAAWRERHAPRLELLTADEMARNNARAQADFAKADAEQKGAAGSIEAQRVQLKKAGMSDDQIDQLVGQLKKAQQQVAEMQAAGQLPSAPQLMTEEQRRQENDSRQRAYDAAKAKFDHDHPADPDALVRGLLENFLRVCDTVDFDAKVENRRFVDAAYESQSGDWKRCYRAGKPAVDAAREIAQKWLAAH